MKKTLTILSCMAIAGTALTSCSNKKKEDIFTPKLDTEKEVNLTIQGGWSNFEALDEVEKLFQEYYPNVTISFTKNSSYTNVIENDGKEGKVDMLFNTKNAKSWAEADLGALYKENMVDLSTADLPLSNFGEDILSCGVYDGVQCGVHIYQDLCGLVVNKTLLEENGYSIPKSLEEFEAICDYFANKDEANHPLLGYGKESARMMATLTYANVIKASNTDEIVGQLNNGVLDESVVEDIVTRYNSWHDKGYFNSINENTEVIKDNYNSLILEFFNGNVPFMMGTSGTFSGCKKRETADGSTFGEHPFEYAFMSMPTGETNENVLLTLPLGMISVLEASPNKDYALEFLRFAFRKEAMDTFASVKGMASTGTPLNDSIFPLFDAYRTKDIYSVSGIGLDSYPYTKLKECLDVLRKENCTATMIAEKYAALMAQYLS